MGERTRIFTYTTCSTSSTTTDRRLVESPCGAHWVPYKGWRKQQQTCEFGSWDEAIPTEVRSSNKLWRRLLADCQTVFSAQSTANAGIHSTGSTYWISWHAQQPRCLLEQLALAILQAHLPSSSYATDNENNNDNDITIGAEWWTLCIDSDDDAVGFHWDLDYEAQERCAVYRTPYAGTVTYLCDTGAPTMILDKMPTVKSSSGCSPDNGTPIQKGWLSLPWPGKHIRFPGACLHGAPDLEDVLAVNVAQEQDSSLESKTPPQCTFKSNKKKNAKKQESKDGKRKKRVSLLVNVWLDGKPGFAAPLDHGIAEKLSPCLSKVPFQLKQQSTRLNDDDDDNNNKNSNAVQQPTKATKQSGFSWHVAHCASDVECQLVVAQLPILGAVREGATVPLLFAPGQAMLL
eukprot:scaffold7729_cov172-Amphora_coffeaeformis.AAC.6